MDSASGSRLFRFGPFELDEGLCSLSRNGVELDVQLKPLEVLRHLILHRDRLVSRDELFKELWPEVRVSPGSLTTAIYELRKAIDDQDGPERRIATLRGLGYRFTGEVEIVASPSDAGAADVAGREVEMERFERLLDAAGRGERRILLVHGRPGMGRTALARGFARRARSRGFSVHSARANSGEGRPQLWIWIQIVRTMIDTHGPEGLTDLYASGHRQLSERVPSLGLHAARGDKTREPGEEQRFKLFDVLASYFHAATCRAPLALILDDLHQADEASLRVLLLLAQDLRAQRLLIVGTHREPAARVDATREALLRAIACEPEAERMELHGLSRRAIHAALARLAGRDPGPAELDWAVRASGGSPRLVAELARALRHRPDAAALPSDELPVPGALRDAVRVRIDECDAECRALLRMASVMGEEGSLLLLREAVGCTAEILLEALDAAARADLLYREPTCEGFRFASAVTRETIYLDLSPSERMRLHRDVGDALERRCAEDPSVTLAALAHHFCEAALLGRAATAASYARRAAEQVAALGRHREASGHLRAALRACELIDPPDPGLRSELAMALQESQARCGA